MLNSESFDPFLLFATHKRISSFVPYGKYHFNEKDRIKFCSFVFYLDLTKTQKMQERNDIFIHIFVA